MDRIETAFREFMRSKGADPFWIDSAWNIVRQGLNTNRRLTTDISNQSVALTASKFSKRVKRYTADITVICPDTREVTTLRLRYTCNPDAKKAHKLWVN